MDTTIQQDLQKSRQLRIFFGHQSVGANILQGVRELGEDLKVEAPQIVRFQNPPPTSGGFLAEAPIGANGDPTSKCAEFLRIATAFPPNALDVALMKFCYVDFTPQTDANELFQLYCRTIDSLKMTSPGLLVVHCTVPLTARTPLWKRFAKRLLGRSDFSDGGNIKRQEYNELLRQHYGKDRILDIAAVESTLPDGSRTSFSVDGKEIYTLAGQYTDDGGHLNRGGRKAAAESFIRVIADILPYKKDTAVSK